jgi:hypothetical protein
MASPADMILDKNGFDYWCNKINLFEKMVNS